MEQDKICKQLKDAIYSRNTQVVKNILKKSKLTEEIIRNAINIACVVNSLDILKILFQYGKKNNIKSFIDNNHTSIIDFICYHGTYNTIKYILDYHNMNIDLQYVLNRVRNLDIIKYIINYCTSNNYEIDIHHNNDEIFINACCDGHIHIMKYLIKYCKEKGSPIDVQNEYIFRNIIIVGRIDSLKYLITYCEEIGCRIDILKYNKEMFDNFNRVNKIELYKYIIEYSEKINTRINIYMYSNTSNVERNMKFININKYLMYLHKHNYNNYNMNIKDIIIFKEYSEVFIKKYNNSIYDKYIYNNNINSYYTWPSNVRNSFNMNYFFCL